jgi:hypothetical protein
MSTGGTAPASPELGRWIESTETSADPASSGSASFTARADSRLPVQATSTRLPTSR